MTSYVDVDLVVRINNKISGQGIRDRHVLEGAVARPWTEFMGHELYPTPWQKAGALFHGLAATQSFIDGNKRTAWLAAQFLLRSLGHELREIPVEAEESFALCVAAVPNYEAEQAGQWFSSHGLRLADRLEYGMLCFAASIDGSGGFWNGQGINAIGMQSNTFPIQLSVSCVFRVIWRANDVGRRIKFDVSFESTGPAISEDVTVPANGSSIVPPSGHAHQAGALPQIVEAGVPIFFHGPASGHVVVRMDDEELLRRPFGLTLMPTVPDFVT